MVLRWRIFARRALPVGVVDTHATRRSASSRRRWTKPAASSLATTFVTLGGATALLFRERAERQCAVPLDGRER